LSTPTTHRQIAAALREMISVTPKDDPHSKRTIPFMERLAKRHDRIADKPVSYHRDPQ